MMARGLIRFLRGGDGDEEGDYNLKEKRVGKLTPRPTLESTGQFRKMWRTAWCGLLCASWFGVIGERIRMNE